MPAESTSLPQNWPSVKMQVRSIADQLPEDATWADVEAEMEERQAIERGLADMLAGRTVPHDVAIAYIRQRVKAGRQAPGK